MTTVIRSGKDVTERGQDYSTRVEKYCRLSSVVWTTSITFFITVSLVCWTEDRGSTRTPEFVREPRTLNLGMKKGRILPVNSAYTLLDVYEVGVLPMTALIQTLHSCIDKKKDYVYLR